MRRSFAPLLAAALLTGVLAVPNAAADSGQAGNDGFTIRDPRITESSGLAASRRHKGVYWTHNDQDEGAFLYAVDSSTGKTVATVTLTGVGTPRDIEAISMGPDNQLYVGDIGDNDGVQWPYVWIYRLPEPEVLKDQTVRATQYVVKYSDGTRDAESMLVHPKTGRVYIIDKQEEGGHLYEGPARLSASGSNVFRPIASVELWATDAALSPDGRQLAVRGYFGGVSYDWNGGKLQGKRRLSVPLQGQGESVSYSADGSRLMFGSEGAGSTVVAREVPGGGGRGGGSEDGRGSAAGKDSAGGGAFGDGRLKVGVIGVLVALAAVFGLRRVFRRG